MMYPGIQLLIMNKGSYDPKGYPREVTRERCALKETKCRAVKYEFKVSRLKIDNSKKKKAYLHFKIFL